MTIPLEEQLLEIVEIHTAGDPDDPEVIWTHYSPAQIAAILTSQGTTSQGTPISAPTVEH